LECANGKYTQEKGQPFCDAKIPCAPGSYDNTAGVGLSQNRCQLCPKEYYRLESDEVRCLECDVGYYQNSAGKPYCDEVEGDSLLKPVMNAETGKVTSFEQWKCVRGIICNGQSREYQGGVWHDPSNLFPKQANMYTCVNEGCPDKGAGNMTCKEGYEGPLCAVCSEEYYEQLRQCVECKDPQVLGFILLLLGFTVVIILVAHTLRRYSHLINAEAAANLKILIGFLTIVSTINTQFGVVWPAIFLKALAVLSALTFDLSVLSGVFCLVKVSFFQSLIFSTSSLLFAMGIFYLVSLLKPNLKTVCIKFAVYLLLFAYPVVSVRCVEAFACHNVDGELYLRADYSVTCDGSAWWVIAGYASVFVAVYVIGFPIVVLRTLFGYGKHVKSRKIAPSGLLFGFLLDDYKLIMPLLMWEGFEMLR
jgi:hypothetical protein